MRNLALIWQLLATRSFQQSELQARNDLTEQAEVLQWGADWRLGAAVLTSSDYSAGLAGL
jgi:hypothetical protein